MSNSSSTEKFRGGMGGGKLESRSSSSTMPGKDVLGGLGGRDS